MKSLSLVGWGLGRYGIYPANHVGARRMITVRATPVIVSRRLQPIRYAGIAMCQHDLEGSVRLVVCLRVIQVDRVELIVEGLDPVVVDLEVPILAFRWHRSNHERFLLR